MNAFLPRKSRAFARTALSRALLLALAGAALPAHADDECGPATDGQVVCEAGETPLPQVHYVGVDDLEVRLEPGVVVDGGALPEGDTAVVLYGTGDLSLQGDTGTTILAHGAWPAVDVVSSDGSVDVRLDTVHGGSVGIAALAAQDVSVWANTVTGATGIEAVSLGGDVVVDVADVEASQFGVFAHAVDGDVNVLAGRTIVTGDYSTGLVAFSEHGSVGIDAGFVRAEGVFAWAIQAQAWEGDVLVDVDTAVAMGEAASAIVASSGRGDVRVRTGWASASGGGGVAIGVFANEGDVYIDADAVYTEGDTSRGIDAGAFGDVHVRAGSATTDGIGSDAIVVETTGTVTVASDRLTTYGDDSYGLRVLTGGDVALDIDQVDTFGERASALQAMTNTGDIAARVGRVHARATTGDWYAIGLSSFEGDVALQVDELVRADSGHAITLGAWYGGAHVVVGEGATVYGRTTAIDAATGAGTRIDILGTVESVDGPALTIAGTEAGLGAADVRIGDTGILRGRVALSGGDDVLASEGRVFTAGTNDFGAGTDRFLNGGEVRLLGDADAMSFAGLERFDNLGLVSLANGRTGDHFALDGTLHGDGSGRLAIDLDVETGAVDRFEVGALTGTQQLQIDLVGRGPLLGLDGVQVFTSDGPQSGDELVLAADSRYRGFVGYRLDYDGIDSWTLDSDLADEAYLAAAVPGGVRDFWRQGTQSVATHLAATRGQADGGGAWLQAVGGDFDGTSSFEHALGSRELSWRGEHDGLQGGIDGRFGDWRAGVTVGLGDARMDLGGDEHTRFDSLNVGAYARYEHDGWFAGAIVRGDRLELDADWSTIGLQADGDGSAIGVELEGGRRFAGTRLWIEPSLRLAWIDVSLPELDGAGGDVIWEDGARTAAEFGLAIGVVEPWHGLRPYASMAIAGEFGGGDTTRYDLPFDDVAVDEVGERRFARFAAGVARKIGPFDLYGEVDVRTGDIEGAGARLGARVSF